MGRVRESLLASAATLACAGAAAAADMPASKAVPVAYVRVCTAFGAGFFTLPGTDTCLRVGGRARFEMGYQASYSRTTGGEAVGFRGIGRLNLDARTQTAYGTLRSFVRLELASRSGIPTMHSGTQNRIANAFPALGVDTFGRVQQYAVVDKAFVQFAGFTFGRASSFYDFYAHDFEIIAATMSSDVASTNLAAYTATLGGGFSATLSMEDPIFRRTPVYATQNPAAFPSTPALAPVFLGYTAAGAPSGVGFIDTAQRSRMPNGVAALRYDGAWGSAQLSAAVNEVNVGGFQLGTFTGTHLGAALSGANLRPIGRPASTYGWAVQGGVKINLPVLATGDSLYLQAAYGEGAGMYTGISSYMGSYAGNPSSVQGSPFSQFLNDAVINPVTGRLELSTSVTVVASLLHYWQPTLRSALFGSYGAVSFAPGSRLAQGSHFGVTGTGPGLPGTRYYALSQILRDNYRFVVVGSLIWSPVKDIDLGVEAIYTRIGVQSGAVLDLNRFPGQSAAYVNAPANPVATTRAFDVIQVRARVQRDF
ncbi:MAG: porin [Methylobacterium sp.]|uniref:porin n=1 Tax=Methylobacterium sp. TaxID=409 RepID=UPI00258E1548|nr:porin [Methylobacterium sp.]MBY0297948.1 porin [Methylobacterium sp.]